MKPSHLQSETHEEKILSQKLLIHYLDMSIFWEKLKLYLNKHQKHISGFLSNNVTFLIYFYISYLKAIRTLSNRVTHASLFKRENFKKFMFFHKFLRFIDVI